MGIPARYAWLGLVLLALLLMWLLWWVGRKRRIQEAGLLAEIRERESRLNLALWGSASGMTGG